MGNDFLFMDKRKVYRLRTNIKRVTSGILLIPLILLIIWIIIIQRDSHDQIKLLNRLSIGDNIEKVFSVLGPPMLVSCENRRNYIYSYTSDCINPVLIYENKILFSLREVKILFDSQNRILSISL